MSARNSLSLSTPAQAPRCSMPDCSEPPRSGQRYCKDCHGKYMRVWRAKRRREELLLRASVVKLRQRIVELQNGE